MPPSELMDTLVVLHRSDFKTRVRFPPGPLTHPLGMVRLVGAEALCQRDKRGMDASVNRPGRVRPFRFTHQGGNMPENDPQPEKVEAAEVPAAIVQAAIDTVPSPEEATAKLTESDDGEDEVFVAARTVQEMNVAQTKLIKWADRKMEKLKLELKAADDNLDIAKKRKWSIAPFKRLSALATKKIEFYAKVKAALEAGYTIIPDMPMDVFAVRTSRKNPKEGRNTTSIQYGGRSWVPDQESNNPPLGEGKFVSNKAIEDRNEFKHKDKEGKDVLMETRWAEEFRDEIDFPFKLAKPMVLSATAQALAGRIFDEIGGAPPKQTRRGDPMVIGRIYYLRGSQQKSISFLISWFIDSKDL